MLTGRSANTSNTGLCWHELIEEMTAFHSTCFHYVEKLSVPQLARQPDLFGERLELWSFWGLWQQFHAYLHLCSLERHFRDTMNATYVLSELHHLYLFKILTNHECSTVKSLRLHANNGVGQNTEGFLLSYLFWSPIIPWNNNIWLGFVIVCHTNNEVHGALRLVKLMLKSSDARTVRKMMNTVELNYLSTIVFPTSAVRSRI